MAFQMVYTSVRSGLVAGRSGFCTAARHREIKESLVARLEDFSAQYDRGIAAGGTLPVVYQHRIVTIRDQRHHVLMRLGDAGNDYTGRTNHIAHCYVFETEEVARIPLTPAEVILHLLREGGWAERYVEAAKFFGPGDEFHPEGRQPLVILPAATWQAFTGAAANAAQLMDPRAAMGAGVVNPDGFAPEDLLRIFAESQLLSSPDRSRPSSLWTRSFTTLMQSSDQRGDFDWYGCDHNGPVHMQALKADRCLIELSKGMAAPQGRFADIAEGRAVAEEERAPVRSEAPGAAVSPQTATVGGARVVLPSATLRPAGDLLQGSSRKEKTKKKGGLPFWVLPVAGVSLLGLVAAAVFVLFGESEGEKFSRKNLESLAGGDWSGVKVNLKSLTDDESRRFHDEDDEGRAFRLVELTVQVAEMYDWILNQDAGASPQEDKAPYEDGITDLSRYLKKAEEKWTMVAEGFGGMEGGAGVPGFLTSLKEKAVARVEGHKISRQKLAGAWTSLQKGKADEAKRLLGELNGGSRAGSDEIDLGTRDLQSAISIMERFLKLSENKPKTEEAVAEARKSKETLEKEILVIVGRAEGRPWSESVNQLYGRIGAFEPELEVMIDPKVTAATESVKPVEVPKEEVKDGAKAIVIPTTYVLRVTGDSKYDLSGIGTLSEAIPKSPYLTPRNSFRADELAGLLTRGLFVRPNLYHEGTKTTTVFKVTAGKTLEPTSKMPADYRKGFFLAFANAADSPPEIQIVTQAPSATPQAAIADAFFIELPLGRVLSKDGGKVGLTEEAKNLLGQLRFASQGAVFQLLWTQGGGTPTVLANGSEPGSLTADLATGIDAAIVQAKAKMEAYAGQKEAGEKFNAQFAELGKFLFCDTLETKPVLYRVEIKPDRDQNGKQVFRLNPIRDKEATGSAFYPTLAEYTEKVSNGRPPIIGYVNFSLYEVYRDHANSSQSILDPADIQFIEDNFVKVTNPDNWGASGIENALAGWKKITEKSKINEWSKPPSTENVESMEQAEDSQRRYPANRYRADFFRQWEAKFTDENIDIARRFLLGWEFKQEELEKMKTDLENLERQRAGLAARPLEDLGAFHVVVQLGADHFRILKLSVPSPR